jgi:hypothetical protein
MVAIADRLAQEQGAWQPFDKSGVKRLFFSEPKGLVADTQAVYT